MSRPLGPSHGVRHRRARLLSISALADGSHAIDEADKRFEEGKQLFGQKRYPEALVKFKEACAAHRTPNCPKNLGFTEYRLDHPAEAATQLREFMKLPEYSADPDRELVRKIYDDLLAKVSQVVIHAADGATIEIDRQVVGKAPLAGVVFATTGKHDIVATLKDDRRTKDFVGEAGKTVEVDLAPPAVVPPPGGGDVKPPPGGARIFFILWLKAAMSATTSKPSNKRFRLTTSCRTIRANPVKWRHCCRC